MSDFTSTATVERLICWGDAETFYAGFGNCSTYARQFSNFGFCGIDADSDGLLASQVCPECGLCYLGTTTTSAHTTTGTSTATSTTSLHSTTDTSSSTTPHTTTETQTSTYTEDPCYRALHAVSRAVFFPGAECMPVNDTCPMECRPLVEEAIVVCDRTNDTTGRLAQPFQAGFLISSVLGVSQGACQEAHVDALLSSARYTPSCADGLFLLSAPVRACYEGDNLSACPEICERLMDAAFDRCTADETVRFGDVVLLARQLVEFQSAAFTPQCYALLDTKTFLGGGGGATSTTAEEERVSATTDSETGSVSHEEERVSATTDGETGSVSSSSMGMSSGGTTTGRISSSTSSGGSSAVDEEEEVSSSHKSGVGLLALPLASILMLA